MRIGTARVSLTVAVTTAITVGVVAAATGAIPGADGKIRGCYSRTNGALRVIDKESTPPDTCRTSEVEVVWNQQGPQGEPGEQGEQGPVGPPGPAASDEVYYASNSNHESLRNGEQRTIISKDLPAGNYRLEAQVYAVISTLTGSHQGDEVVCRIPGGEGFVSLNQTSTDFSHATNSGGTVRFASAIVHPGGPVTLTCVNSTTRYALVKGASLLATKVATVG